MAKKTVELKKILFAFSLADKTIKWSLRYANDSDYLSFAKSLGRMLEFILYTTLNLYPWLWRGYYIIRRLS